ncbi:hypothetical protein GYMLUDRAFT_819165 [Collybiopsis luxurians FD-317 M1]|uniref:Uncharacterized protein n=1 Tax=Collybiopsis luxurians FD-317 M1 TaxID=944289 RepID=A0A0D0B052_9AGAR|nr:hypothetical protein GYMLUDRAFT_819165 [Collybiopsis luxurians FD-317 M1]
MVNIDAPLSVLCLRSDLLVGSWYFGVMAFVNAINISTFYYPSPYLRGTLTGFANSVSVILMSRLMFNLHRAADSGLFTSHRTTMQLGTQSALPEFRPVSTIMSENSCNM